MTAVAETAAARREFDRAMALLDDDAAAAWARFGAATAIDPQMADAWLGRYRELPPLEVEP